MLLLLHSFISLKYKKPNNKARITTRLIDVNNNNNVAVLLSNFCFLLFVKRLIDSFILVQLAVNPNKVISVAFKLSKVILFDNAQAKIRAIIGIAPISTIPKNQKTRHI